MTDQTQPRLQVGGQIDPRKHLYIVRTDIEDQVFELLRRGEYCNILSSRQVGKSSLRNSVGPRLQASGVRVVDLDIVGNLGTPSTATEWYQGLVNCIAWQLRLELDIKAWWDQAAGITANEKLTEFFRVVVNFDVIAWFTHNAKLRLIANCRLRDHSRITHYPFTQSLQKLPLPFFEKGGFLSVPIFEYLEGRFVV